MLILTFFVDIYEFHKGTYMSIFNFSRYCQTALQSNCINASGGINTNTQNISQNIEDGTFSSSFYEAGLPDTKTRQI